MTKLPLKFESPNLFIINKTSSVRKFGKLNMLTYNHSEVGNLRKQPPPLMLVHWFPT
ncbi:MAG: hypothetical protein ACTS44_00880 [Candidatus Hodgkinia cicadicola]